MPVIDTGIDTPPEAAIAVIMVFYVIAAIFNWYIPDTGVDHRVPSKNPLYLVREFSHCVALLWRDQLGQISLATTTLFWGAGATLQFIVIDWAARALSLNLSQAAMLQGVVAFGIAVGAMLAARLVTLRSAVERAARRRGDGRRRAWRWCSSTTCRSRCCSWSRSAPAPDSSSCR